VEQLPLDLNCTNTGSEYQTALVTRVDESYPLRPGYPNIMILLPMVMTTDYVTKGSESDTYIYNHKKVTKDVAYSTIVSPRNQ